MQYLMVLEKVAKGDTFMNIIIILIMGTFRHEFWVW